MLPPVKKSILSHQKMFYNGAWSVHISLLIQMRQLFHWRKQYYELWTLYGLKLKKNIND